MTKPRIPIRSLQLIALFFVAFNLRIAMAGIGPVLDHLRIDLAMSHAQLGLLSTLPVLCMGIFAPFAQRVSAVRGHEVAILVSTLVIAVATLARAVANEWILLVTALLAGIGIAVTGTLLNTFVKQYFATNAVSVSGLYSASLCLGAALAAGCTAPITDWSHSWRFALSIWSIFGFIGALLWWRMLSRTPAPHIESKSGATERLPWTNRKAWLITVFFGLQSITFYVVLAWLAPLYIELGWSAAQAGALLSYWIAAQVTFILLIARLANRSHDRRPWLIACSIAAAIAMLGFAFAPQTTPWLWILLLGFANGGWFPLSMTLPLDYSRTPAETGRLTAMMLFGGYLLSAGGPWLAGLARDHGHGYASIFATMALLSVGLMVLAMFLRPPSQA